VSYVRFSGASQLVSASTDSTLRLWGLEGRGAASEALRVYEGHSNEKNFVGLAGRSPVGRGGGRRTALHCCGCTGVGAWMAQPGSHSLDGTAQGSMPWWFGAWHSRFRL
jgi:hypothetical protein